MVVAASGTLLESSCPGRPPPPGLALLAQAQRLVQGQIFELTQSPSSALASWSPGCSEAPPLSPGSPDNPKPWVARGAGQITASGKKVTVQSRLVQRTEAWIFSGYLSQMPQTGGGQVIPTLSQARA